MEICLNVQVRLSGNIISKRIDSTAGGKTVANILLCDSNNPKRPVFKLSLWEADASAFIDAQLEVGDEVEITGKIYCTGSNTHGIFIEVRKCKLISVGKIDRKQIVQPTNDAEEGDSDE